MTRPVIAPKDQAADSTVSEIHALYHEGAGAAAPDPSLDRIILNAARAELQANSTARSRRQAPVWKRWLPATTAIAVAVVGLSLSLRVTELQEGEQAGAAYTESALPPARNSTESDLPPKEHRRDNLEAQGGMPGSVRKKPAPASASERRALPAQQETATTEVRQAPAAISAPPALSESIKKSQRSDTRDPPHTREPAPGGDAASALATPLGKLEARRKDAGNVADTAASSAAPTAPKPAVDASTPEAWLNHIRELFAAGRDAEAEQSLERFRSRFPDFALPADLNRRR